VFAVWGMQSGSESLYEVNFDGGTFTGQVVQNNKELVLNTGKGSSGWNKSIEILPGKLSWKWEGKDVGDFQLWLRLSFNNHKLYYVADGSVIGEYKVHLLS